MQVSRQGLEALARESGFRSDTLEKVVRLGELLSGIYSHPLLSQVLHLKGGSALNLGFGPPARLSVDLDFNCVGFEERERMLEARPDLERALGGIARAQGYRVQQSGDEHAGRKFYLGYRSSSGTQERIEVDLNFLHRIPLSTPQQCELWQPGDLDRPTAVLTGVGELCAGKLCALLARALPRDLYDTARLPYLFKAGWGTLKLRRLFVALAGALDHPLHRYGRERLEAVTDRAVEEQLLPMLSSGDKPSAGGLREAAWSVVGPFLELSNDEREFTDRLQYGDLRPELLFPDDADLADRLRRHPVLLWKAKNAKKRTRRL